MRICMVTPHLPPEQAANALLPPLLARELEPMGVFSEFVAHPHPTLSLAGRGLGEGDAGGATTWAPRRGRSVIARTRVGAAWSAGRMAGCSYRPIARANLAHLHSNGLLIEVAGSMARWLGRPYIVTLYGTDVWHHEAERHRRFGNLVRSAAHRVFYSQSLLEHARTIGLAPESSSSPSSVIYAPVDRSFHEPTEGERRELRARLGVDSSRVLLTVKRLHPVGGHADLVAALPRILERHPSALVVLAGEGELRPALEAQVRELGVVERVRFVGRVENREIWQYYAAADLFVLPSHLESWGTVMLEALACGTPVVASDTAGAREVQEHFGRDVMLYRQRSVQALVEAVGSALSAPRRATDSTMRLIADRFSPAACAHRYLGVYEQVLRRRPSL